MKFENGDRVRVEGRATNFFLVGRTGIVKKVYLERPRYEMNQQAHMICDVLLDGEGVLSFHASDLVKVTSEDLVKVNENKMTNLKEKFVTALLKEPEKSFRKAGITNGDGLLTDDGQKIFLTWMLNQNADKFKADVVDPLLADEAANK